jgi:hypothetical protein
VQDSGPQSSQQAAKALTVPIPTIIGPPAKLGDVLDLLAGLIAIALIAVVYSGGSGLPRILLTLGFTLFVPGRALVTNWPQMARWSEVGMPIVFSLAILTFLATITLWAHVWRPLDLFQAEAWLSIAGLSFGIIRRRRRHHYLLWAGGPNVQRLRSNYPVNDRGKLHSADFLLPTALGMWALGVSRTDATILGPYGLPPSLPVVFYAGVALLVVSAAIELARNHPSACRMSAHTAALVVMLYGTAPIVYSQGRYSWLYKTIGVVQYVNAHGQLNRFIDIYHNWPGFFALAAWFGRVARVASPLAYAKWAQLVFELAALPLLYLAYNALSLTVRQRWVALLLFSASNFIGQDYFSPQALGTVLSLGVMAMALRWFYTGSSSGDRQADQMPHAGRTDQVFSGQSPHSRRPLSIYAAILFVYFVLTFTHELSPYTLAVQLGALAVARLLRPRWLPILFAAIAVGYLLPRFTYVNTTYGLFSSLGTFFRNILPPATSAGNPISRSQQLIEHCEQVLALYVWGLALAGAWLRRRSGQPVLALVILAFSPFIVLAIQAYGNEGILRIYLFSLPWAAALAALALAPPSSPLGRTSGNRTRRAVSPAAPRIRVALGALRVPLALGIALALFFPAFFGNDSFNTMPKAEVAALTSFFQTAPAGPLYTLDGNDPLSDTAGYDLFPIAGVFDSTGNNRVTLDIANVIASAALDYTGGKQPAYVVIAPSDVAYILAYGLGSSSDVRILAASLAHSPEWKLVVNQAGTVIYKLQPSAGIRSHLPPSETGTTVGYPSVPLSGYPVAQGSACRDRAEGRSCCGASSTQSYCLQLPGPCGPGQYGRRP